jgi:putative transposase
LLGFTRSTGESQVAWEGLLQDLYRRGLEGRPLQLVVTDGCAGLAAALQTIYPRVVHQRCWVHKLRNLLSAVRRRDHGAMKTDAQAIYQAASRAEAEGYAQGFVRRWRDAYPQLVARLLRDRPELLACFQCPRRLWRKLRTTNVIERCFVEVRRRTRPMVGFVNVQRVERIIFSIFNRCNLEWRQHTLRQFTQVAGHHQAGLVSCNDYAKLML